jgi:hypothetical protein
MGVRLAYILIKKLVTMCTTWLNVREILFCVYDYFLNRRHCFRSTTLTGMATDYEVPGSIPGSTMGIFI